MAGDQRRKRLNCSSCDGTKRKKPSLQSFADCLFELKDLTGVLSHEVWHSHLSDTERSILSHHLPREADPDQLVQELLSGHNFHFGNPFLTWGASLCSGKLHPGREQHIKAKKKMYLSQLQNYHNDMIESLQRWKNTLDRCKDPQEDDDTTTPESSPQATSDKPCCNNKPLRIAGDSHRRNVLPLPDSNVNKASDGLKVPVKPKTEEKLQKRNSQLGDSAKYMSYIKPFEESEEEERQKLRDYWFRLATREFPAFYANWRERKLKSQELVKSMCQDLEEKLKLQEKFLEQDDENDNPHKLLSANNVDTAGELEDEKTLSVGQMAGSLENEEDEKTDYAHERQKYEKIEVREQVPHVWSAGEMIDLEAGTQSDICFHDCFSDGKHMLLPKRMGLDFDEAMAMGFPDWSGGLDQTLFSVLSDCNSFSATSSSMITPVSEQSSSLEWHQSGYFRPWNQY